MSEQAPSKERIHELKCWPKWYAAVKSGEKPFEMRVNDRDYQVGDVLWLREWKPASMEYTGDEIRRVVTFVLRGDDQPFLGLDPSYCIMGLAHEPPAECQHLETIDLEDSNARWCTECGAFHDGTQWVHSRQQACPAPPPAARKPDKFDLAFEIMRQLEAEDMETMQSCQFGYVMRVTRERASQPPAPEQPSAAFRELQAIARAARDVCAYDWSDNDDDAVAAMDRLHKAVDPWLARITSTNSGLGPGNHALSGDTVASQGGPRFTGPYGGDCTLCGHSYDAHGDYRLECPTSTKEGGQ